MKQFLMLFVFFVTVSITSLAPSLAQAEDVSGALANYNNPHDICDYYRGISMTIVRETDNECTVSIGEGEYKVFTQVYYSGNEWCAKVINNSQTYQSKCIPRKNNTDWNSIYLVVGFMIVLFIVIGAINSIGKNKKPNNTQYFNKTDDKPVKASVESTADELEKLYKLKEKGTISQKEFNLAKKKLLK